MPKSARRREIRPAAEREKTAVGYIRVSTEEQVRGGVSLEAQHERIEGYCRANGLDLVELIREEGVSGSKRLEARPGGNRLASLVGMRKVRHVVTLKLDRLFRDAADALNQTQTWDRADMALHLVDIGGQSINTKSAMGRMFLTMMAGFAELERNLIAERTAAALAHKKRHRQVYGTVPYGYSRDSASLCDAPLEQEVVLRLQGWRRDGWTLRAIAAQLNHEGIPCKAQGRQWYASTVRAILLNDIHTPSDGHSA